MMRIRVKTNFGGRLTNEERIAPDDYDHDDPALFGIADYLLEHGFAVRIEEPLPMVTPETELQVNVEASPIEIVQDDFNGTIQRNKVTGEERVIDRTTKKKRK